MLIETDIEKSIGEIRPISTIVLRFDRASNRDLGIIIKGKSFKKLKDFNFSFHSFYDTGVYGCTYTGWQLGKLFQYNRKVRESESKEDIKQDYFHILDCTNFVNRHQNTRYFFQAYDLKQPIRPYSIAFVPISGTLNESTVVRADKKTFEVLRDYLKYSHHLFNQNGCFISPEKDLQYKPKAFRIKEQNLKDFDNLVLPYELKDFNETFRQYVKKGMEFHISLRY